MMSIIFKRGIGWVFSIFFDILFVFILFVFILFMFILFVFILFEIMKWVNSILVGLIDLIFIKFSK